MNFSGFENLDTLRKLSTGQFLRAREKHESWTENNGIVNCNLELKLSTAYKTICEIAYSWWPL